MKWGVIVIIANYLIPYVFQLHIKYYRQIESFYFVHSGKDRHQPWSSTDFQAVLLITPHTTPNHTLNLRCSSLSSPGVDENHHIQHSGNLNLPCFSLGFLGAKGRGICSSRVRVPWWLSQVLAEQPLPQGCCWNPVPHPCRITVTYCHLCHPQSSDKVLKTPFLGQRQKNLPATISLTWSESLPVPVAVDEHVLGSCIQWFVVDKVKGQEHISCPGCLPMAQLPG